MDSHCLIVPGYTDSGPQNWQSLWERELPKVSRVRQADWEHPEARAWTEALDASIAACPQPPILLAHSLGVTTVANWALKNPRAIQGAFLVVPPDPSSPALPEACRVFAPMPRARLRFPSCVVASSDDPYADLEWARGLAADWGAQFVVIERAGHLNTDSGHGPWPEGRALLEKFAASLPGSRGETPGSNASNAPSPGTAR